MTESTLNFHIQTSIYLFKIPTELIRKNFKTTQRLIEKQKRSTEDEIKKVMKSTTISAKEKLDRVRTIRKSFEDFQNRLRLLVDKDEMYSRRILARLKQLTELAQYAIVDRQTPPDSDGLSKQDEMPTKTDNDDKRLNLHDIGLMNWYRDQTNILVIEYLIKCNTRSGTNLGLKFLGNISQLNPNFMELIDYDLYDNMNKILLSIIQGHDLSLVISWVNNNKAFLKKINSNLEFEVNYCKLLSLIDEGDMNEAINFSQRNLSHYGNFNNYNREGLINHGKNLAKLKEIGGLLVYVAVNNSISENSYSGNIARRSLQFYRYQTLLSRERWESVAKCFVDDFTSLYSIPEDHPLFIYMSAGLSSLKTKSCYYNTENTIFRSSEDRKNDNLIVKNSKNKKYRSPNYYYLLLNKINHCPVCSPELFKLSKSLPYAQLITSIFNNPFKFPNGNIYAFDKLISPSGKFLSERNTLLREGKVKDPLTKEVFSIANCTRVYPA